MLVLITQLIPVSASILLSQPLLCLPVYSVGAWHASSLWCHHSLYCSLFNWSLSSRVCLSLASRPIPSSKLICNYFRAAQSFLNLNHVDQIAWHLLSFILWNQFIPLEGFSISLSPGILSLTLLTVNFFFCL